MFSARTAQPIQHQPDITSNPLNLMDQQYTKQTVSQHTDTAQDYTLDELEHEIGLAR